MSVYPNTIIETDGRLMCEKKHAKTISRLLDADEGWLEVVCETCGRTLFYNGA